MSNYELSTESMITVMLCSYLSLDPGYASSCKPLSPSEWNNVKSILPFDTIVRLPDISKDNLEKEYGINTELAFRMENLLKRGGNIALEIEQLIQKGIWILTESDDQYPSRFREKLGVKSPPVLFGAGDQAILSEGGIAIVGSRDVDDRGKIFAQNIAEICAREKLNVISGAARGVDRTAMSYALEAGGKVTGVLADSLESFISASQIRETILDSKLTVITHLHPSVGFSVANAMSRNKLIYALSDYAIIVSSAAESGGTWQGATESLKHKYAPVFVRFGEDIPEGNTALIKKGAFTISEEISSDLLEFLAEKSIDKRIEEEPPKSRKGIQQDLFKDN
jgi:DNA processing protein